MTSMLLVKSSIQKKVVNGAATILKKKIPTKKNGKQYEALLSTLLWACDLNSVAIGPVTNKSGLDATHMDVLFILLVKIWYAKQAVKKDNPNNNELLESLYFPVRGSVQPAIVVIATVKKSKQARIFGEIYLLDKKYKHKIRQDNNKGEKR